MTARYKVTGIDPGDTAFRLGNCLTIHRSRDFVNTPGMYATIRSSAMSWLNPAGQIHDLIFFDKLFWSDVVLDHEVPEPRQQGDAMEGAVLVAALLIAFPDAQFGIGLQGGGRPSYRPDISVRSANSRLFCTTAVKSVNASDVCSITFGRTPTGSTTI